MTATLRKLLTVFEIAFVICFGLVNESRGQTQSLTAFYAAPVVSMAPMWIAKEAGFFKKQGLEVKLLFIASGPLGTTAVLASEVDQTIIVVQHRRFPRAMLTRVKQAVIGVGGSILGVVLNNVDLKHDQNYYYYTNYYGYYQPRDKETKRDSRKTASATTSNGRYSTSEEY